MTSVQTKTTTTTTTKVGIDLSLRSPGLCVIHNDQINLYYWPQRKRYKSSLVSSLGSGVVTVRRFDMLPEERYARMARIAKDILSVLQQQQQQQRQIEIIIEGYAFGHFGNSASTSKLAEMCGHLKTQLRAAGYTWSEVYPTSAKKSFCRDGNASKSDMVNEWYRRIGVNLSEILHCRPDQSPYHDMIDAFALASHFSATSDEPLKKKRKKSK